MAREEEEDDEEEDARRVCFLSLLLLLLLLDFALRRRRRMMAIVMIMPRRVRQPAMAPMMAAMLGGEGPGSAAGDGEAVEFVVVVTWRVVVALRVEPAGREVVVTVVVVREADWDFDLEVEAEVDVDGKIGSGVGMIGPGVATSELVDGLVVKALYSSVRGPVPQAT